MRWKLITCAHEAATNYLCPFGIKFAVTHLRFNVLHFSLLPVFSRTRFLALSWHEPFNNNSAPKPVCECGSVVVILS